MSFLSERRRVALDALIGDKRLSAVFDLFDLAGIHQFVNAGVADGEQALCLGYAHENRFKLFHDKCSVLLRTGNYLYAQMRKVSSTQNIYFQHLRRALTAIGIFPHFRGLTA